MRATETTRSVYSEALIAFDQISHAIDALTPNAMTTVVPCLGAERMDRALDILHLKYSELTILEAEHLRRRLNKKLDSLANTWVSTVCDHDTHTMSSVLDRLSDLWLIPGADYPADDAAESLMQQLVAMEGTIVSAGVTVESSRYTGRLGAIIGDTENLTITLGNNLFAVSEDGSIYISGVTLRGNKKTRARINKETLFLSNLIFEVQPGGSSVVFDAAVDQLNSVPCITIDAATIQTLNPNL